jgi:hypothetical protein
MQMCPHALRLFGLVQSGISMSSETIHMPRSASGAALFLAFPQRNALLFVAVLTILRIATASYVPLSFDECYFWLWSKNLAISYYDHPPLIALSTWLGTALFGETQFGVRFVSLALSVAASWAVWQASALILKSEAK